MSDSSTHWNLNERQQLQLPHSEHLGEGHTDEVYAVQLQDDYLVSASADRTVRVWNLTTQRLIYPPLTGHTGSVTAVQFDAQDDIIITGDSRGNVIIWRFSTGETVTTIKPHSEDVVSSCSSETILSLCFNDRYLVTGSKDSKIKLWNCNSTDVSLLGTFDGHDNAVLALKLRDDILVSGSGDSTMCIWSLPTGEVIRRINIYQSGVSCLQYNGRFLISGSTDNSAKIYDIDQNIEIAVLEGHTNLIRSIQVTFDKNNEVKTVVTGSYDGCVRIWEQMPDPQHWRTQQLITIDAFHTDEDMHPDNANDYSNRISSIDFDAKRLICSGHGPIIRFWDFRLPRE